MNSPQGKPNGPSTPAFYRLRLPSRVGLGCTHKSCGLKAARADNNPPGASNPLSFRNVGWLQLRTAERTGGNRPPTACPDLIITTRVITCKVKRIFILEC